MNQEGNTMKYTITGHVSVTIIFLAAAIPIWFSCGAPDIVPAVSTQEFLNGDQTIDWSSIKPVQMDPGGAFDTYTFAAVSRLEGQLVIHGRFDPDVPVVLINRNGLPANHGRTDSQGEYNGVSTSFQYTNLDIQVEFPAGSSLGEHEFIFAVTGEAEDYEVLPLWPWAGTRSLIAEHASDLFPDEFTGTPDSCLFQRCRNPEVFRFFSEEKSGIMVCYAESGTLSTNLMRTWVVICNDIAFKIDVSTGGMPILFSVNGGLFLYSEYRGYHNGFSGPSVYHLDEDGIVWSNSDWSM